MEVDRNPLLQCDGLVLDFQEEVDLSAASVVVIYYVPAHVSSN